MANRRPKPKMGDALVINWVSRELAPMTVAAMAECECGDKVYTAVSGSFESCRKLIYRKHSKHLTNCARQRQLFAIDEGIISVDAVTCTTKIIEENNAPCGGLAQFVGNTADGGSTYVCPHGHKTFRYTS